jgi:hypothetical protein
VTGNRAGDGSKVLRQDALAQPYNWGMSGTRLARVGFAVYALTIGLAIGMGFWHQHVMQLLRESASVNDHRLQLKLLEASFIALEVFGILALAAATRLPASLRAGTLLWTAAGLAALGLVVSQCQRFVFEYGSVAHVETLLRVVSVVLALSYAASEILALVVGLRVARATGADWLRGLAIAAIVSRALTAIMWQLPFAGAWTYWLQRATYILVTVACAGIAAVLSRLPETATPVVTVAPDGRLAPAWREPAAGISLYLGAAVARIVLALISYAVMASARGATSLYELRDLRGQVLTMAVLSGLASVGMLVGLWRISRAPAETRASGPALLALALGCCGLLLDGWATSITADALGGSVSAAFFAMDALPWITGLSLVLGIGLGLSLLRALGDLATALERTTLVDQTRSGSWLLVGAGAAAVLGLAMAKLATELLLVFAILAVPLALAAAVQLIRAALGVSREIRARV